MSSFAWSPLCCLATCASGLSHAASWALAVACRLASFPPATTPTLTSMPTLGPTPSLPTSPLCTCVNYHSTPTASTTAPPELQNVITEGVGHANNVVLDARQYKFTSFAQDLLRLLATLRIAGWGTSPTLSPQSIKIHKVSGSLTNAVFFISHPRAKTLILRVYGLSSSCLISRPHELHILHVLSSQYRIGPRVYGTFANGRVEQYFESEALSASEMRDPQVSAWIGMRMAELHCVDLNSMDLELGEEWGVRRNVRQWLGPAREVLRLAKEKGHAGVEGLELERFAKEWEGYWAWLMRWESVHGQSERVFTHNDTQCGNLLRLKELGKGKPAHHKIIVVDFEYASANAAAFDIANHFHEWMADYQSSTPHELKRERYPGLGARRNFYIAYLTQTRAGRQSAAESTGHVSRWTSTVPTEGELDGLDGAVRAWSAASHGMWAVWGIVQAREDVLSGTVGVEFDYLGYAQSRMRMFRDELGGPKKYSLV